MAAYYGIGVGILILAGTLVWLLVNSGSIKGADLDLADAEIAACVVWLGAAAVVGIIVAAALSLQIMGV